MAQLWPIAVATSFVIGILVALGLRTSRPTTTTAEAARSVALFVQFAMFMNFSVVILDAYGLSASIGQSATHSGMTIGIYQLGCPVGGVVLWSLMKRLPHLWRQIPHHVAVAALLFNIVGGLLYLKVALAVRDHNLTRTAEVANSFSVLLLSSRLISGVGLGMCNQLFPSIFAHITP